MKYRISRRLMAAALALALLWALPARAEEIETPAEDAVLEILPDEVEADEAPVGEVDELPLDEAPVAYDAPADLGEIAEATAEAVPTNAAEANTSVPAEDYETEYHSFDLGERIRYTLYAGDALEIFFPKSNGKSWKVGDSSVARISDASDQYSVYLIALAKGTTTLTLKLSNGQLHIIILEVRDPYALKSMKLTKSKVSVRAGMDLNLARYITLKPAYAKPGFTYKSSKPSVARVNSGGIVTGMKAGSATVTVTSANGLSKKIKVTVKKNATAKLHSAPTKKAAKALGKAWTLWPRTLELRGDGTLICKLYLLNGTSSALKSLRNLDLAVSLDTDNGENLIAEHLFGKVSVSCAKKSYATVALTFPAKHVYYSGVKLSSLDTTKLRFRLYQRPTAKSSHHTYAYSPSAIEATGDPTAQNPVQYRALLVSEDDFYFSRTAGRSSAWEHISRNKNDAELMSTLLGRVSAPDGGRYSVTVKHNTSRDGLVSAIQSAFGEADENDVSLFFIATHGDSADATPADRAGALVMASLDETYPEYFYLSELRDQLLQVPGKVIVILESCGAGASVVKNSAADNAGDAQSFDLQAANLFRDADPGVVEGATNGSGLATNTGELRRVNKFYVLCCSEYREESWGLEPDGNFFTRWLAQGVGKSGSMPADRHYAGNKNGIVDLHELYRYIAGVGDSTPIKASGGTYYQHVQVYPSSVRFALFK